MPINKDRLPKPKGVIRVANQNKGDMQIRDFSKFGNQLHAGIREDGDSLWHTDSKGLYWSGYVGHRTPSQLLNECITTIKDLMVNHPELNAQLISMTLAKAEGKK